MSIGMHFDASSRSNESKSSLGRNSGSSELPSEIDFISPSHVEEHATQYEQHSHRAKTYLIGYGQHKPGTEVSLRFLIEAPEPASEPPYSLLPLLSKWLRLWFDRSANDSAEKARVTWLLQYIADYIGLGHSYLNHEEVCSLCEVLLYICNKATHYHHLEGCLAVFLSITTARKFPGECLEDVLSTLCKAVVILDKPLFQSDECMKLLATGDLSHDTIQTLYNILSPTRASSEKKEGTNAQSLPRSLTPARGAARHLRKLLELTDQTNTPVVELEPLLSSIEDAANSKVLRLATELLYLLAHLLRSTRVRELVEQRNLVTTLLMIYDTCQKADLIPDTGDSSVQETEADRARRYKQDNTKASGEVRGAIATILPLLDEKDSETAWTLILEGLDGLSAVSRTAALEHVLQKETCVPGKASTWSRDLLVLIDKVVIGKTKRTDLELEKWLSREDSPSSDSVQLSVENRVKQRVEVLALCTRAIEQCAKPNEDISTGPLTAEPILEIAKLALSKLLSIFGTEQNMHVLEALLKAATSLCNTENDQGEQPYAEMIISSLQTNILASSVEGSADNADLKKSRQERCWLGAEALRLVFLHNLASTTSVAKYAYQALLVIANCEKCKSRKARLVAMTLLLRIRCDTSGTIYIDQTSESSYIASALCKTEQSLKAMFSESDVDEAEVGPKLQSIMKEQLWMYPREQEIVQSWSIPENPTVRIRGADNPDDRDIDISDWMYQLSTLLQKDEDWETYSFAIVHFGSQLLNTRLFEHSQEYLAIIRGFLAERVRGRTNMFEPPKDIGLDKSDVALCIYHVLTNLIPYARMQPPSQVYDSSRRGMDVVRAFRAGIGDGMYSGTARTCIHALSICCFELPEALGTEYPAIIDAMAKNISQSHLLVHILEFLAQVARLPHLHKHFNDKEIHMIFGICINALRVLRADDQTATTADAKRVSAHTRNRGGLLTPYRAAMLRVKGLTQYSSALAYHTMIFWFLSIPISRRQEKIQFIMPALVWTDAQGQQTIDQQTVVLIDMMQRTAFSDLPETARDDSFSGDDYDSTSFIDGNSVITIETNRTSGRSQITKRQASGTTHAVYTPLVQELTPHHDRAFRDLPDRAKPSHTFLNMVGSAVPIALSEQPLKLNSHEAYVSRALGIIDRIPTLDSHGIGVTLLKDGQTSESEYLENDTGTPAFNEFIDSLGTRVSLHPPVCFTAFGLDPELDGEETIAWRDRINEIVYEISTLMPNADDDQYQARKKSHLGNCAVVIVFNQSNKEWRWEYFQSQATMVNIVITPANHVAIDESSNDHEHEYYIVDVLTREEYHNISAAAERKIVSKATLPQLIRLLALNANIFSGCARNESTGDAEFPSSWRYRLKEIVQLRERTQQRVHDIEDTLARRYDFNRWT